MISRSALLTVAMAIALAGCGAAPSTSSAPAVGASAAVDRQAPQSGAASSPAVASAGLPAPSGAAASPSPTATVVAAVRNPPTRVVIPSLNIDLAIVPAPGGPDAYPYCGVAMYLPQLHVPGEPGATYVFAHARTGMFLPLLEQSRIHDGAALVGKPVDVYTSGARRYEYTIASVHRHVLTLNDAINEPKERLYLQTSEGPHGTPQKLQVVAIPRSNEPVPEFEAVPTPHPVACGP